MTDLPFGIVDLFLSLAQFFVGLFKARWAFIASPRSMEGRLTCSFHFLDRMLYDEARNAQPSQRKAD